MSTAFKLRNGTLLLSTEAPGGIYNAAQLKKIASLCEGETAIVKATEDQRLALFVKPEQAGNIASELKAIGLGIRHYQDGLHHPTSCIGELCPDHEQDALGSALDISQQLEAIKLASPLKIGINGCARCCVPCHTLDISVVGDAAGYRMHLGGKNSQLPEMASFMAESIPPAELPQLILKVIELYQKHSTEGESLQEVIERVGAAEFIGILAPYSQDASGDSDPFAPTQEATPSEPEAIDSSDGMEDMDTSSFDATPELVADESGDLLLGAEDTITAPEELNDSQNLLLEDHTAASPDELSLVENEELSMDTISDVDVDLSTLTSPSSFGADIDPKSIGDEIDVNSEIEISHNNSSISGPDIALSEHFGEDDIEELHESNSDATIISEGAGELEAMPEDDLFLNSDDDISEAVIDVSDVMKTAPATAVSTDIADESLGIDDIPVENFEPELAIETELESKLVDEDAYEKQLNASIAAQEQLVDQSTVDEDRESTLDLLNENNTSLDDAEFTEEVLPTSASEVLAQDELSLEEEAAVDDDLMLEEEMTQASSNQFAEVNLEEDSSEFEESLSDDPRDHLPLSEVVGTIGHPPSDPTPIRQSISQDAVKVHKSRPAGWNFAGLDVDADSNPVLSFSNGVQITLTEEAVATGSITVGGHQIVLTAANGGIEVQMDGMKMFLPKAA